MPNHVTNTLEIHVWNRDGEDRISEVRELVCPKDSEQAYIDFAAIIPPPDNMFTDNLSMEDRKRCAEQGIPNWYDWQCENWGTKWNAYDENLVDQSTSTLILRFDTAWAPPAPVIERLREILEEKYGDEGDVFVQGGWVEEGYQSAGVF